MVEQTRPKIPCRSALGDAVKELRAEVLGEKPDSIFLRRDLSGALAVWAYDRRMKREYKSLMAMKAEMQRAREEFARSFHSRKFDELTPDQKQGIDATIREQRKNQKMSLGPKEGVYKKCA